MRRRFLSVFCCIVIVVSMFSTNVYAQDDTSNTSFQLATELLTCMGIIDDNYLTTNSLDYITRADFVLLAVKLINMEGQYDLKDKSYYIDVPMDFWALNEINFLVENGILSVPQNQTFRPDDPILYSEALKIMLAILEYDEFAEVNGGYPTGYYVAANRTHILDNLSVQQNVTYKDAVVLAYNTLRAPVAAITVEYGEDKFTERGYDTLLQKNFKIDIIKDTITAAEGMVVGDKVALSGEVALGKIKYFNGGVEALKYLGHKVTAYVAREADKLMDTVIYIEPTMSNDVKEFNFKNFVRFDDTSYELHFYKDDNADRVSSINISRGAIILKNYDNISNDISGAFKNLKDGKIMTVDANNDGKYDYVFIEEYFNIVVGIINAEDGLIADKYNPTTTKIDLSAYEEENIKILQDGKQVGIDKIKVGMLLSVMKSAEYVTVHVCTETVSGSVIQLSNNPETKILIGSSADNGEWYFPTAACKNNMNINAALGASGIFHLDYYGNLAYFELTTSNDWQLGMVTGYDIDDDGFSRTLMLRILTQYNTSKIYKCKNKLMIDNETKVGGDAQYTKLLEKKTTEFSSDLVTQVIRIKAKNEEIIAIDVPLQHGGTPMSGEFVKSNEKQSRKYYSGPTLFAPDAITNTETVFFVVPENLANASEEDFGVIGTTGLKHDKAYNTESYKLDIEDGFEKAIVLQVDLGHSMPVYVDMFLVSGVMQVLGDDGEVVDVVTGYRGGGYTEIRTTRDVAQYNKKGDTKISDGVALLKEGDIIKETERNYKGEMSKYVLLYDYAASKNELQNYAVTTNKVRYETDFKTSPNFSVGAVANVSGGVVSIDSYNDGTIDEKCHAAKIAVVLIYDKNAPAGKRISEGTVADIKTAKHFGQSNAAMMVSAYSAGTITWAVVYQ